MQLALMPLFLLVIVGCASGDLHQDCPPGSTPVVNSRFQTQGCYKTELNQIQSGSSCGPFSQGDRTIDAKGDLYECKD